MYSQKQLSATRLGTTRNFVDHEFLHHVLQGIDNSLKTSTPFHQVYSSAVQHSIGYTDTYFNQTWTSQDKDSQARTHSKTTDDEVPAHSEDRPYKGTGPLHLAPKRTVHST